MVLVMASPMMGIASSLTVSMFQNCRIFRHLQCPFRSIVTREKDKGVFQLARLLEIIDYTSNLLVHDSDHRSIDLMVNRDGLS